MIRTKLALIASSVLVSQVAAAANVVSCNVVNQGEVAFSMILTDTSAKTRSTTVQLDAFLPDGTPQGGYERCDGIEKKGQSYYFVCNDKDQVFAFWYNSATRTGKVHIPSSWTLDCKATRASR